MGSWGLGFALCWWVLASAAGLGYRAGGSSSVFVLDVHPPLAGASTPLRFMPVTLIGPVIILVGSGGRRVVCCMSVIVESVVLFIDCMRVFLFWRYFFPLVCFDSSFGLAGCHWQRQATAGLFSQVCGVCSFDILCTVNVYLAYSTPCPPFSPPSPSGRKVDGNSCYMWYETLWRG